MKKILATAAALVAVLSLNISVASSSQAAGYSCTSIGAELPYIDNPGISEYITAHTWLYCSGTYTGGWVKASLVKVRTLLPNLVMVSAYDYTQNSADNFHAYASRCDAPGVKYGYKTVAAASNGGATSSGKVDLKCQ